MRYTNAKRHHHRPIDKSVGTKIPHPTSKSKLYSSGVYSSISQLLSAGKFPLNHPCLHINKSYSLGTYNTYKKFDWDNTCIPCYNLSIRYCISRKPWIREIFIRLGMIGCKTKKSGMQMVNLLESEAK